MTTNNLLKKYKHKIFAVLIAIGFIIIDYFTKILAVNYMPKHQDVSVIPYLFKFRFLYNDGAAFGILDNARWVFMLATIVFIIVGIIVFLFLKPNNVLVTYAIMLILSGGIGNMIDRTTTGLVVDFITFDFMPFPSFNVADCCVVIGCTILIIYLIIDSIKSKDSNNE